jgi:threonine aldolase
MRRIIQGCLLLGVLLAGGCTINEFSQQSLHPVAAVPYSDLQVQVSFDTPAHSTYLAQQLVARLEKRGISARLVPPDTNSLRAQGGSQALLQLHLTDAWTETFISTRTMPRRSLTQMRGRILRESPRFDTEVRLVDLSAGNTVWQADLLTAGAWYTEFHTNADALATTITKQLTRDGLIKGAS